MDDLGTGDFSCHCSSQKHRQQHAFSSRRRANVRRLPASENTGLHCTERYFCTADDEAFKNPHALTCVSDPEERDFRPNYISDPKSSEKKTGQGGDVLKENANHQVPENIS